LPAAKARFRILLAAAAVLSSVGLPRDAHAQGGAAVITLVMPVGARQLGMGEAATALSDDVYGTYWNPGGLAFGPVSDEWELMYSSGREGRSAREFTAIATKPRTDLFSKPAIWAGARDGLVFFDGRRWRDHHEYSMEQGDKIAGVVRRYVGGLGDIDSLTAVVRAYNGVRNEQDEEDLITLKLPYNLLFPNQAVTAMAIDAGGAVWVGTAQGLFRFENQSWKSFEREEGFTYLPANDTARAANEAVETSDSLAAAQAQAAPVSADPFRKLSVTALAVKGATVWIGTNDGLYEYKRKIMARRGQNLLPSQHVTSIGVNESVEDIYIGLQGKGVARYRPPRTAAAAARWKIFTAADGLIDDNVTGVTVDKYGHVYTSHAEGVSHFSLRSWEKLRFKGQNVRGVALDSDDRVWIATSGGAWLFTPPHTTAKGRRQDGEDGAQPAGTPQLMHYHSGNGLRDKNVIAVRTQDDDVWFLTSAGVERYHSAKTQVGFFYETLLPALNLKDLYHAYMAATFPIEEWGTLGGFVNYISFGQNLSSTGEEEGRATFDAYELVAGLTYATRLNKNAGLGINAKFIYSALSRGQTSNSGERSDGVAASYAVDLGFLQKNLFSVQDLSFGFVMQNMGPAVFYVDQAQSDPIPFTWKVGFAYGLINQPNHRLTLAADINREAFYRNGNQAEPFWIGSWKAIADPGGDEGVLKENLRQSVYNTGLEYVYGNVVAVRTGYLNDISGQRRELDIGLGFMLSDILQIDGCFIRSFDNGIRNGQQRYSMILRF
jgi:ligand-binding sensor domain-containing protein